MRTILPKFVNYWDEAALETLGSEFEMMSLMLAQPITNLDGSSILDKVSFDDGTEINVPEEIKETAKYFKAPWDD